MKNFDKNNNLMKDDRYIFKKPILSYRKQIIMTQRSLSTLQVKEIRILIFYINVEGNYIREILPLGI